MTTPVDADAPEQTDLGPVRTLEPPQGAVRCSIPILFLENYDTGDSRVFLSGEGNGHRELPVSLFGLTYTSAGGHEGAEIVGRIDTMTRRPGPEVTNPDTGEPFPADVWVWSSDDVWLDTSTKTYALVYSKFLRGVSCDLADYEVEIIWSEDDDDGDMFGIERIEFPKWRLAGATVVPIPAFSGTRIELPEDAPAPAVAASEQLGAAVTAAAGRSPLGTAASLDDTCAPCLTAAAGPAWTPPAAWFADPQLPEPTPLTITDDGRIVGHIAQWNTCHAGLPGCVTAPHSRAGYSRFLVGETVLDDGQRVPTGHLTVGGGHAKLSLTADQALAHYDDVATALGPVTCGEDEHGIWLAGAVYPDAPAELVARARSSAPSGDWRRYGHHLELVAVHQVNLPGYQVKGQRNQALLSSDGPTAMVASLGPRPDVPAHLTAVIDRLDRLEGEVLAGQISRDLARLLL